MKKTIKGLEAQIANLAPYQEAFHCMMRGEERETFTLDHGDQVGPSTEVEVIGLGRMSGGVVIRIGDTSQAIYVSDYCARLISRGDPYERDLVSKIQKASVKAHTEGATWHVVSDAVGTVLAVYGAALLADAQESARAIKAQTGGQTYLHSLLCNTRPRVGQSISMTGTAVAA